MLTKTVDDNFKSQAQNISVVNYFLSPKRDLGNPVLVVMQHCQVSCVPCLAVSGLRHNVLGCTGSEGRRDSANSGSEASLAPALTLDTDMAPAGQ